MHTEELKQVRDRLLNILKTPHGVNYKESYEVTLNIINSVIQRKTGSEYCQYISTFKVHSTPGAQIRRELTDPKHLQALKNSIEFNGVMEPLLLVKDPVGPEYGILNGNHRNQAVEELIVAGILSKDYKYPAIVISVEQWQKILPIASILQSIFNETSPKKANDTEDRVKAVKTYVEDTHLDVSSVAEREKLVAFVAVLYPHLHLKGVKNIVSRVCDRKLEERSDIVQRSPEKWVDACKQALRLEPYGAIRVRSDDADAPFSVNLDGYKGVINGNVFRGIVTAVSLKGSSFDQRLQRDLRFHYRTSEKYHSLLVLIAQDTKGNESSVINTRKAFFTLTYENFQILNNTRCITWDYVVVAPQFKSDCSVILRKGQSPVKIKAEHSKCLVDWKIIDKATVVRHFSKFSRGEVPTCYDESWICTKAEEELE